jgi:hypothetical protein
MAALGDEVVTDIIALRGDHSGMRCKPPIDEGHHGAFVAGGGGDLRHF